jgi:hypothetical protein
MSAQRWAPAECPTSSSCEGSAPARAIARTSKVEDGVRCEPTLTPRQEEEENEEEEMLMVQHHQQQRVRTDNRS